MKTPKNIIIIVVISIIAVLLGVILALFKNKPAEVTPIIPQPIVPTPIIESSLQGIPNIRLVINKEDIKIPKKAVVYSLSRQSVEPEEVESISRNLGFTEKPIVLTDPRVGNVMLWSNSGSLRIAPSQGKIDYKTGIEPSGKFVTKPIQEELVKIAKDFITKNRLLNKDNFQFSGLNIRENEIENYNQGSESSQIAVVMFNEIIGEYPIINTTTEIGTISVVFNAKSQIVRVFVDRISNTTPVGEYPVKIFQEVSNTLSQAKILSLDEGKMNISETPPETIVEILVNQVSFGYLQENTSDQKFLQPIFVLKGSILLKNSESVTTTLYLPALAPPAFTPP